MIYDPIITQLILAGVGGILSVQGVTEYIKKLFTGASDATKKILGYVISMLVSGAFTGGYLLFTKQFTLSAFFLYAVSVWFVASGLYDVWHPKTTVK
jgi:uncharacterized membrane protein HdeD (DUF308 family)